MLELVSFQNVKYKKHYLLFFSLIAIFLFILVFKDKYISNIYKTYGLVECDKTCHISLSLNYEQANILNNSILKIENKKMDYEKIEYGDVYLENNIPVQEIIIIPSNKIDEKIVKVQIEYKKQRIISKIISIILER